jgi:hypothetical protein
MSEVGAMFGPLPRKGNEMSNKVLNRHKDLYAEFAFEQTMRLAGGEDNYGTSTQAAIWSECHDNKVIKQLVGMYLYGSSERADLNLSRLNDKLTEVFGL